MTNAPATLEKTIREIHGDVRTIKTMLEYIQPMVEKHERALYGGNGDGGGIISLARETARTVHEDHELIHGEDEKPGLKGNVNRLMEKDKGVNELKWIVIGSAIGTAVSAIVTAIVK